MSYKHIVFVLILGLFFFGLSFIVQAAGLYISPIKVSCTLEPGDLLEDIITLKNPGDKPVAVTTTVEDFIPIAGGTGISFVQRAEGVTTVRDWITQTLTSFELGPGQEIKVPFTIQVPADAEPGSHFGVLFFRAADIGPKKQLDVGTRVGTLMFVTVPGDFLQKGRILEFKVPKFVQKGPVGFSIKFENTGTVHFEPKGSIKITNIFGKLVAEVPVQGQTVLPTGQRDLGATWQTTRLLFGYYKAEIGIYDGEGNLLTAKAVSFYAFPILYLVGGILVLVVIFFGLKFLRSRLGIKIVKKY